MARHRPSFVVTMSAAAMTASCSSGETKTSAPIEAVEMPRSPTAAAGPPTAKATPDEHLDLHGFPVVVNPTDDQNRTIFSSGDGTCYIHLPFPALTPGEERQPGTPPPSVPTQCPESMNDPTWKNCSGGTIHANEQADTCVCFVMGNPPYPPRRTQCPAK